LDFSYKDFKATVINVIKNTIKEIVTSQAETRRIVVQALGKKSASKIPS
jgi:hypothetical protein